MLDDLIKLSAFDELHAEVARAVAFAYFVDRNDARMIEAGGGQGFAAKAFQIRFARPMNEANDFQRDRAIETLLSRGNTTPCPQRPTSSSNSYSPRSPSIF